MTESLTLMLISGIVNTLFSILSNKIPMHLSEKALLPRVLIQLAKGGGRKKKTNKKIRLPSKALSHAGLYLVTQYHIPGNI